MIKINCDSFIGRIEFEHGEVWENIPTTGWLRLMEKLLPKSINDKYFETDYKGIISQKRYETGKIYYKNVCRIFRVEDTSDEQI